MAYQQLTQEQRYQISALREVGLSLREIGKRIQAHYSSVSRELRRNLTSSEEAYHPAKAQQQSDRRRREAK